MKKLTKDQTVQLGTELVCINSTNTNLIKGRKYLVKRLKPGKVGVYVKAQYRWQRNGVRYYSLDKFKLA